MNRESDHWAVTPNRRRIHPALYYQPGEAAHIFLRVITVCLAVFVLGAIVSGCAMTEHRDGRGYTVRFDETVQGEDKPKPRPHVHRASHKPKTIIVRERERESVNESELAILNIGKDDEIPREYSKFVSNRGITGFRQRSRACRESRPGYCSAPNVIHCHGSFCHAHPGGDKKHTH